MEDFVMYDKYLEQLGEAGKIRNLKERSINCYKNYVSYFLKYQAKPPEELTCQDVRTFLLAKKEEGLKATTLNLYNSAIRFFYRNVLHILWDDITVPRMILEHKLPTILTVDEIDRLLEAVDDYIGKSSLYYILRYLFSGICDDTSYIALN
jgi:site-specific recombinase XerD